MYFSLTNTIAIDIRGVFGIQTYLCSGSTYIQSLLDDHPNLLGMPGIVAMLIPLAEPTIRAERDQGVDPISLGFKLLALLPFLDGRTPDVINGMDRLGESQSETACCDGELFAAWFGHFYAQRPATLATFLASVYLSYALASGRALTHAMWICHPIHETPIDYREMLEPFPHNRIIYVIRDIDANYASTSRHLFFNSLQFNNHPRTANILTVLQGLFLDFGLNGFSDIRHDVPLYPDCRDQCRALRLEDVKSAPRNAMAELANWLEIPWANSLLDSSFNGLTWWNRLHSPRSNQGVQDLERRRAATLSAKDRLLLRWIGAKRREAWGYAPPAKHSDLLRRIGARVLSLIPMRWESCIVGASGPWSLSLMRSTKIPEWLRYDLMAAMRRVTWRRQPQIWKQEAQESAYFREKLAQMEESALSPRAKRSFSHRLTSALFVTAGLWISDIERYWRVRQVLWRAIRDDRARFEGLTPLLKLTAPPSRRG